MGPMGFPLDPWESLSQFHGNGNENGLLGMEGNENFAFSHFSLTGPDHQTQLMDPCFCIVICRRLLR